MGCSMSLLFATWYINITWESAAPGSRSSRFAAAPALAAPLRWAVPGSASRHRPRAAAAGRQRSCSWVWCGDGAMETWDFNGLKWRNMGMGERNMKFNMKFNMIKQWHNNGPKDEKDGPKDRGVHVSMSHQWKMVLGYMAIWIEDVHFAILPHNFFHILQAIPTVSTISSSICHRVFHQSRRRSPASCCCAASVGSAPAAGRWPPGKISYAANTAHEAPSIF
mgnify:CR=1 FL=1